VRMFTVWQRVMLTTYRWERYRFLGADLQIRKVYFRFQVFECICYFSAFFCAGFGIQVCLSFFLIGSDHSDERSSSSSGSVSLVEDEGDDKI